MSCGSACHIRLVTGCINLDVARGFGGRRGGLLFIFGLVWSGLVWFGGVRGGAAAAGSGGSGSGAAHRAGLGWDCLTVHVCRSGSRTRHSHSRSHRSCPSDEP